MTRQPAATRRGGDHVDVKADSPRLRRLIERPPATAQTGPARPGEAASERCDLCAEPIPPEHRHVLELSTRELQCVCPPCRLLFERPAAGGESFRLVPERRWHIADFDLSDPAWAGLRIPVGMAFFVQSSAAQRVVAYYPSPAGPTESLLELTAWDEIAAANPVLAGMAGDVEALLVNRAKGTRDHWLAPVDDCYELVGLIRTHWKGLSGGDEVWAEIEGFFARLKQRAKTVTQGRQ